MSVDRLTAADYHRCALGVLGEGGPDALTIAELCGRLSITKGSFYHHFGSMPAFVEALLEFWEREHSELLIESTQSQDDPALRLLALKENAVTLPHAPEAAIRAWSRSSAVVADAVVRVDRRRDKALVDTIVELGLGRDRARLYSRLGLAVLVGVQNRERSVDERRLRHLFDEIIRMVFLEAGATPPE